ncbi:hypothetical protein DY000_02013524 [Brassica cretica]|uniref:SLC26A/SulP transporter domain-containing protein n=1 Tax=Brassica cretica TaxID=69181 RepID=A0ABQ7CXF3_BRACR|nr:hypothetical protein DY000_02013524 [Brassica cretica]
MEKTRSGQGTERRLDLNVELVGENELQYGEIGRLVVVPAEAPIRTHAGRLGQCACCGQMNEPRSNCSERPDLHAGWLQWTDPRTGAHQFRPPGFLLALVIGTATFGWFVSITIGPNLRVAGIRSCSRPVGEVDSLRVAGILSALVSGIGGKDIRRETCIRSLVVST